MDTDTGFCLVGQLLVDRVNKSLDYKYRRTNLISHLIHTYLSIYQNRQTAFNTSFAIPSISIPFRTRYTLSLEIPQGHSWKTSLERIESTVVHPSYETPRASSKYTPTSHSRKSNPFQNPSFTAILPSTFLPNTSNQADHLRDDKD